MKRLLRISVILFLSQNVLNAINNPFLLINKDLHDGILTDFEAVELKARTLLICLLYTSPSPRDGLLSRMPSSA